ncbi:MAG: hypothetical protein ABWX90_00970, partial [Candidatus Saccharimonadales bacterium]
YSWGCTINTPANVTWKIIRDASSGTRRQRISAIRRDVCIKDTDRLTNSGSTIVKPLVFFS